MSVSILKEEERSHTCSTSLKNKLLLHFECVRKMTSMYEFGNARYCSGRNLRGVDMPEFVREYTHVDSCMFAYTNLCIKT